MVVLITNSGNVDKTVSWHQIRRWSNEAALVGVLTRYLYRALAKHAWGRRWNSDASSYTNKHYRVLQQNSSACDVIAVVDVGSAADPGGHWPPFASWAPRGYGTRTRCMVRLTAFFFFLCRHVLIANINCSGCSQPFEPIQNTQMTFKAFVKVSNCTFPTVAPVCLLCLKFYDAFSFSCFT